MLAKCVNGLRSASFLDLAVGRLFRRETDASGRSSYLAHIPTKQPSTRLPFAMLFRQEDPRATGRRVFLGTAHPERIRPILVQHANPYRSRPMPD